MKLAVFLPNWIGDAVMATPTLRALRKHFGPSAKLVGIARPAVADCLAGTPWLDEIWPFVPRGRRPKRAHRSTGLAWRLRRWHPDRVLLLTNSFRTGMIARASGAKLRTGYHRFGRQWMLTDRLFHHRRHGRYIPTPVLDDYLRLAYHLGCATESPKMELAVSADDRQQAADVWQRLEITADRPVVLLNSSGAFGAAKLWPGEYFAELARRIAAEQQATVLVMCGPSEREIARAIAAGAAHPSVLSLADEKLSIGLSKACVERSELLVTTDSGPRHFAAALDVPVITLFGPTHIAWSETHYPRAVHLQETVPCGPCQQRVCPLLHHQCMRNLSVDRVYAAVHQALTGRQHETHRTDPGTRLLSPHVVPHAFVDDHSVAPAREKRSASQPTSSRKRESP